MLKCALILYNDINPVGLDVDVRWYNGDIFRNGEVNRVTLLYQPARTTSIIMESHAAQWQMQTFIKKKLRQKHAIALGKSRPEWVERCIHTQLILHQGRVQDGLPCTLVVPWGTVIFVTMLDRFESLNPKDSRPTGLSHHHHHHYKV